MIIISKGESNFSLEKDIHLEFDLEYQKPAEDFGNSHDKLENGSEDLESNVFLFIPNNCAQVVAFHLISPGNLLMFRNVNDYLKKYNWYINLSALFIKIRCLIWISFPTFLKMGDTLMILDNIWKILKQLKTR